MREQSRLVIGCPNLPNLPILVYLICLTLPKVSFFFFIFQIIYKFTMQVSYSQLPSVI